MRVVIAIVMLTLLGAVAVANPFTLAYKDEAGADRAYFTYMYTKQQASISQAAAKSTMVMSEQKFTTTEHVDESLGGKANISTAMSGAKGIVTMLGKAHVFTTPALKTAYARTISGQLSGVSVEGEKAGMLDQANGFIDGIDFSTVTTGPQLPEKAVCMGEHWSTTTEVELMRGLKTTAQVYNWLTNIKTVNGKTLLQIDSYTQVDLPKTTTPDAAGQEQTVSVKMLGKSYTLFNVEDGVIEQITFKGNVAMTMAAADDARTPPITVNMKYYGVTKKQ